ncbi:hypothetical protein F5Y10DRAFT_237531 [Nemania abortiva]|nr:hypothetical protein F5Y10DRAFT_237531 [Nemania abortiva]
MSQTSSIPRASVPPGEGPGDQNPSVSIPPDATPQPNGKRFECPIPDCRRMFNRKEHVTRHLKSHDPVPRYQCHICGRRYVRSDVLRRHVSGHAPNEDQYSGHDVNTGATQEPDPAPGLDSGPWDGLRAQWPQLQGQSWQSSALTADDRRSSNPVTSESNMPYAAEWATAMAPLVTSEIPPENIPSSIFNCDGPSTLTAASLIDTSNSTPSSDLQTHISPNSSYGVEDGENVLPEIDTSLPETQRLVRVYFAQVHPSWPILHQPTFEIDKASKCLVGSMMMNAAYHEGSKGHEKLARIILGFITGPELMSNPSLHLLQALLLCVVYSLGRLRENAIAARTTYLNAILISACRSLGIFEDRHLYHSDMEQAPLSMWSAREQLHRLAFAVLCVDTHISVILDHPPTVRYQELRIPLPMSTPLWEAGDAERRRLQWQEPAGRQRVLFSSMMRDVLESGKQDDTPYQLDLIGCHLGLCALQSGVWEAAREAHSSATDELSTKFAPGTSILDWRDKVTSWRNRMEEDCSLERDYFSSTTTGIGSIHPCSALSLILGHLYYLHMYAPTNTLRGAIPYGDGDLVAARRAKIGESKRRLRTWITSPCSRFAVWNAAQISRVIEHELSGNSNTAAFGQNPLAIPSLLTSAIVVCFIANVTSACPSCTSTSDPDVNQTADLFETHHESDKLKKWRESGTGLVSWGPGGIVICACKTQELVRWFQSRLSVDASAEAELLAFVDGLSTVSL